MPIDFLADNMPENATSSKRLPQDFLAENESPPESLGTSLAMAIPRIGTDLFKGGYNFLQNIPEYYQSAKTEVPGLFSTLKEHPGHAGMQALAGSQELINKLAQAPLNLVKYGENRLNILPPSVQNAIQKITPDDTTQAISQLFDKPQYAGETMLRGAIRDIPELFAAGKIASLANPLKLATATQGSIAKTLTKAHDILESDASKGFKTVSQEFKNRNLPNVPVEQDMIAGLADYFPKTKQAANLLSDASTGNYNSLRKLQSDLYTSGKKNLNSPLETDRMKGAEMFEKREDINQAISDHLKNLGQDDLDKILNDSRAKYKKLQEVYYNPNLNNSIVNMVDRDIRKKPSNLVDILSEESVPMKKLIDYHPGLENQIRAYLLRQKIDSGVGNAIGKYGIPLGAGALGTYEALKYMRSNNQ